MDNESLQMDTEEKTNKSNKNVIGKSYEEAAQSNLTVSQNEISLYNNLNIQEEKLIEKEVIFEISTDSLNNEQMAFNSVHTEGGKEKHCSEENMGKIVQNVHTEEESKSNVQEENRFVEETEKHCIKETQLCEGIEQRKSDRENGQTESNENAKKQYSEKNVLEKYIDETNSKENNVKESDEQNIEIFEDCLEDNSSENVMIIEEVQKENVHERYIIENNGKIYPKEREEGNEENGKNNTNLKKEKDENMIVEESGEKYNEEVMIIDECITEKEVITIDTNKYNKGNETEICSKEKAQEEYNGDDGKKEIAYPAGKKCREIWSTDSEDDSGSTSSYTSSLDSSTFDSSDEDSIHTSVKSNKTKEKTKPFTSKTAKIKTKGELDFEDLPPIEDLHISVKEEELEEVGTVCSIVEKLVVVQSLRGHLTLDLDSVLFLEAEKPLGQIFDVFGPVINPSYAVRFNDNKEILDKGITKGMPVYCAPSHLEITRYVFADELKRLKGSDASWEHNNEPPEQLIEYSDDDAEKQSKNQKKKSNNSEGTAKRPFQQQSRPFKNNTKNSFKITSENKHSTSSLWQPGVPYGPPPPLPPFASRTPMAHKFGVLSQFPSRPHFPSQNNNPTFFPPSPSSAHSSPLLPTPRLPPPQLPPLEPAHNSFHSYTSMSSNIFKPLPPFSGNTEYRPVLRPPRIGAPSVPPFPAEGITNCWQPTSKSEDIFNYLSPPLCQTSSNNSLSNINQLTDSSTADTYSPPQLSNSCTADIYSPPQQFNSSTADIYSPPQQPNSSTADIYSPPQQSNSSTADIYSLPQWSNSSTSDIYSPPQLYQNVSNDRSESGQYNSPQNPNQNPPNYRSAPRLRFPFKKKPFSS